VGGLADIDPWDRGIATLLASWEENARGSDGAALRRLDGVAAATFPVEPERSVYNNAVLQRDLGSSERRAAVEAMEAAYADIGVERFAAWVHEDDEEMQAELGRRGYAVEETTQMMAMEIEDAAPPDPAVEVARASWPEYLAFLQALGLPPGILAGVAPDAYEALAVSIDGEVIAAALAFDHEGDCGVFNLFTLEQARRRGLGRALTAHLLRAARRRGCTTASLQSTPMAEGVYANVGFQRLGRILEYTPGDPSGEVVAGAGV
jgi:GNAT superfamily N-acetyltransferase